MFIRRWLFNRQHCLTEGLDTSLRKLRGFTLIEVLVAMSIFAIGFLGIAKLFLQSIQMNQSNYYYSVAGCQLNNLVERLRANQSDASRRHELNIWNKQSAALIADSEGDYSCSGAGCTVELHWQYKGIKYQLEWQRVYL